MVLSYSLKYLSRCYSEDILYMWLKSIISWHQVKEIILDNLGEPGLINCKVSRTELNFPKGKEIPLWATASACGESSCAESSSLPFLTIAHLMVLHFSSSPSVQFSSQSCPTLCNPMDCSCQASLSITTARSLLKLISIKSVMPSKHLILCHSFSSCLQSFPASGSFQWVGSSHESVHPHIV